MADKRKILVTTALPYANGSTHLGHMVEHIQADIWVRFQKMRGHDCLFICGDDAHGTPIMLKAEELGVSPEELIKSIHQERLNDFSDFFIKFDNYHTTHSEENKELTAEIYKRLEANNDIEVREIEQAYDPVKEMFLPDRYVKGTCPKCGAEDQYGDNCEVCGSHYNTNEIVNPISTVSGATPVYKKSAHFFFKLDKYSDFLKKWMSDGTLQPEVANKLNEWFEQGLQQWDISRDKPYFGFEIPGHPGKYFYVWLDAPVGYMASLKNLSSKRDDVDFDEYWKADSAAELYHFIGKDIMYFHALFWPAMLKSANFRTPTSIYVHGFLTVNGQKMSKSRGTFIEARRYLDHLNPEYYRYYLAAKLGNSVDDSDLNLEDFVMRVNSDLVGKYVNIASRCAGFITKKFNSKLAYRLENEELFQQFTNKSEIIAKYYEEREYHRAVREIMALADIANQYINDKAPWKLAKEDETKELAHLVCTQALNMFKVLTAYLNPILPELSSKAEKFLNISRLEWDTLGNTLTNHEINKFEPLLSRLQNEEVEAMINAGKNE